MILRKNLLKEFDGKRSKANRANNVLREHITDAELIQDQTSTSSDSSSTSLTTLKYSMYFASVQDIPKPTVASDTNAIVCRNNTYFASFIVYDVKKKFLFFLLNLMNCCDIKSPAYIACVLQQLLQTPLAVLIEIYFIYLFIYYV